MQIAGRIKTKHQWLNRIDPDTGKRHNPKAIVLHITGGSFESTKNWIQHPHSSVSYNWIICDGKIYECVPEQHAAWANGHVVRPKWSGIKFENNEQVNPNLYTVSVAVVNNGEIPTWRTWEAWVQLNREIRTRMNIGITPETVVNHFEIKTSKRCPKPYFTRSILKVLSDLIK